jgi:hypothetical protein
MPCRAEGPRNRAGVPPAACLTFEASFGRSPLPMTAPFPPSSVVTIATHLVRIAYGARW